jgi:hypothetical protein
MFQKGHDITDDVNVYFKEFKETRASHPLSANKRFELIQN